MGVADVVGLVGRHVGWSMIGFPSDTSVAEKSHYDNYDSTRQRQESQKARVKYPTRTAEVAD